ncbi:RT0821/Lpp0805 family surface protein [Cupriavidus sp. 2TAF22]|uniref:RT0821/Lpp0805 family surface protein n=1 Tax=unclassified Cupriavidus TaxID=2640874 RepID=UPI003F930F67
MTPRQLFRTSLACAALLAPAAPALAYFDTFVNATVIGKMSQKESAALAKSVGEILNTGADGAVVPWNYPATSGRRAIEGSLTPLRSKTDQGQSCRLLRTQLKRDGLEDNWTGWFCKQSDGRWKSRKVSNE